jgi:hypothetical protein
MDLRRRSPRWSGREEPEPQPVDEGLAAWYDERAEAPRPRPVDDRPGLLCGIEGCVEEVVVEMVQVPGTSGYTQVPICPVHRLLPPPAAEPPSPWGPAPRPEPLRAGEDDHGPPPPEDACPHCAGWLTHLLDGTVWCGPCRWRGRRIAPPERANQDRRVEFQGSRKPQRERTQAIEIFPSGSGW